MKPMRPVWAEISRSHLLSNWNLLRNAAPQDAEVLAVLKANAYGHDARACGPLLAAAGARWFGVTCVDEGKTLRRVCPDERILIMSGLWDGEADAIIEHRLTPQIWEPFHFDLLEAVAHKRGLGPQAIPVHLEIDTGMSRQGVRSLDALKKLLTRCSARSSIQIEGIMTHFSAPEMLEPDATQAQIAQFAAALEFVDRQGIRPIYIHAGNSASLFVARHLQILTELAKKYGAQLMLRPGIALYGYPPRFTPSFLSTAAPLKPVLAWKTRVISLREIKKDESAGYNMTFRAAGPTQLGLVPVGYADGLNRLLSNCGQALVRGQKITIAGRVSMDQTILDVTDVPGVTIGDEVVLIGEQNGERITAYDLADATGTIPYEVTCAISGRVPRILVD